MTFERVTPDGKREPVLESFEHASPSGKLELFRLIGEELGCAGFVAPALANDAPDAVYAIELVQAWQASLAVRLAPSAVGDRLRKASSKALVRFADAVAPFADELRDQALLADAFPAAAEALDDIVEHVLGYLDEPQQDAAWFNEFWNPRLHSCLANGQVVLQRPLHGSHMFLRAHDFFLVGIVLLDFREAVDACVATNAELRFRWS